MPKLSKNTMLAIALVIVAVVGYYIFFMGKDAPEAATQVQSGASSEIGQQIVAELARLKTLRSISPDLFANPAFVSLQDYTQIVLPQPVGRSNPFAPAGL